MAYAGWNKGSQALLLAIRALAAHEGVDAALVAEWARSQPDVTARSERAVSANIKKAWRFVGEMEEIAATFTTSGCSSSRDCALPTRAPRACTTRRGKWRISPTSRGRAAR